MSAASLPTLARIFGRNGRSEPAAELKLLLERIGRALYPESVSVVASSWLKSVYTAGHNRAWWGELDAEIGKILRDDSLSAIAAEPVRSIRMWVRRAILPRLKAPAAKTVLVPPFRPDLTPEQAAPYLRRVLNEWLPAEVARQLTAEAEFASTNDGGMPARAVARALEQLLLREHFSPATLELLFEAAWLSPKYAYPAHLEIFREVVLGLLGRTAAPAAPVLPATPLFGGFADALERAALVQSENGDELHVPLNDAQAVGLLRQRPVHIGSIAVTMDGRWWESVRFQSGPETAIVYRPGGRLEIDFTCDHARLVAPWPDDQLQWRGAVHLPEQIELFGRRWRGRVWDRGADRTWLHLEFAGVLTMPEERGNPRERRARPASAEMAWSEVEQALATGTPDAIERIHREDLIPLAYALERLVDCLQGPLSREDLERSLRSVRYLHGAVAPVYGRIPWRVLPEPTAAALLKMRGGAGSADVFSDTFSGAPEEARTWPPRAA